VLKYCLTIVVALTIVSGTLQASTPQPDSQDPALTAGFLNSFNTLGDIFKYYRDLGIINDEGIERIKLVLKNKNVDLETRLVPVRSTDGKLFFGKSSWSLYKDGSYKLSNGKVVTFDSGASAEEVFTKSFEAQAENKNAFFRNLFIDSAYAGENSYSGPAMVSSGIVWSNITNKLAKAINAVSSNPISTAYVNYILGLEQRDLEKTVVSCVGNDFKVTPVSEVGWESYLRQLLKDNVRSDELDEIPASCAKLDQKYKNLCINVKTNLAFIKTNLKIKSQNLFVTKAGLKSALGGENIVCGQENAKKVKAYLASFVLKAINEQAQKALSPMSVSK